MVRLAARRRMELQVESLTGAAHRERSLQRAQPSQRYSDRDWDPRGTAERSIPKLRKAGYFPAFPRRTGEKALIG
jgi:putative transposase